MLKRYISKRSTVDKLLREVDAGRDSLARSGQEVARLTADLGEVQNALRRESEALNAAKSVVAELSKPEQFSGHYYDWRIRRQAVITEHFGADWFRGKRVLELACGYGDIGAYFLALGADVTFSEAREEHLQVIRERYPSVAHDNIVQWDAETGIPAGEYDLIIHMGVLYHLDNWQASVAACAGRAKYLVLETEVMDSDDPDDELKVPEHGPDQAFAGVGSRPSAPLIEKVILEAGMTSMMSRNPELNSTFHTYDWEVENTKTWRHGLRRFWFIEA